MQPTAPSADRPSVSVVVPVYNDPDGLRATLDSLADQTYPSSAYEVVIVDNDSTDGTAAVARSIAAENPAIVRLEHETEIQSSYAARNTGIRESAGEILAFVDADVTVDPDWLESGVDAMAASDAAYMGCRVDVPRSAATLAGRYDAATGFPVERYVEEYAFAPTCALFVTRTLLNELGAFDPALVSGGDTEFGNRVADAGREIHYAPDVRVEHPPRTSLRSLLGKYARVGRGMIQRGRRYPDRYSPRPLYDPVLYLPPHPLRFHAEVGEGWNGLSRREKVGLYVVEWVTRLAESAGKIAERFGIGDTPDETADRPESLGEPSG